jgi:hypothetical protein
MFPFATALLPDQARLRSSRLQGLRKLAWLMSIVRHLAVGKEHAEAALGRLAHDTRVLVLVFLDEVLKLKQSISINCPNRARVCLSRKG